VSVDKHLSCNACVVNPIKVFVVKVISYAAIEPYNVAIT